MYINSIDQLHHSIRHTPYYLSKGKVMRAVTIDKCNILIDSIIRGNRHHKDTTAYKPVPLSRNILRELLGTRDYLAIIETLEELGYIIVDHTYKATGFIKMYNDNRVQQGKTALEIKPHSKHYSLTPQAIEQGIKKVGILTPRMEDKIKRYKAKQFNEYHSQELHQPIIDALRAVHYRPNTNTSIAYREAHTSLGIPTHKELYIQETHQDLQRINSYTKLEQYATDTSFYYTVSSKVNRVFHYYGNIPTAYRESLIHKDGNPLSEIDLANSQPLLITLHYYSQLESPTDNDKDLLHNVLNGLFYSSIASTARKLGDLETFNLYSEDYSKFKRLVLGEGLYFNYIPDTSKIKPMEKILIKAYPKFMAYIRNKKRNLGYKSVAIEAQQAESNIFINQLFPQLVGTFAIPVHDSVIVKSNQVDAVLKKLIAIFANQFNLDTETASNLFRIKHYE